MSRPRIGERMFAALAFVRDAGGSVPCKLPVAEHVGPHGSRRYGYATVDRCIAAGLLALDAEHPEREHRSAGIITLTRAGRAALAARRSLAP